MAVLRHGPCWVVEVDGDKRVLRFDGGYPVFTFGPNDEDRLKDLEEALKWARIFGQREAREAIRKAIFD
jgi:hypothetical protein